MLPTITLCSAIVEDEIPVDNSRVYQAAIEMAPIKIDCPVTSDRPNPEHRTEPSAEIWHIYRTRSAILVQHSSVGRTIVR